MRKTQGDERSKPGSRIGRAPIIDGESLLSCDPQPDDAGFPSELSRQFPADCRAASSSVDPSRALTVEAKVRASGQSFPVAPRTMDSVIRSGSLAAASRGMSRSVAKPREASRGKGAGAGRATWFRDTLCADSDATRVQGPWARRLARSRADSSSNRAEENWTCQGSLGIASSHIGGDTRAMPLQRPSPRRAGFPSTSTGTSKVHRHERATQPGKGLVTVALLLQS